MTHEVITRGSGLAPLLSCLGVGVILEICACSTGAPSSSPWNQGSVYIASAPDPTISSATTAGADFISYASHNDNCTHESHGPCATATCGMPPTPFGFLSAGTVIVSSDVMTQQVSQLINGTYNTVYFPGDLWSQAGATVTVSAPGGDVPAFSEQFPAPAVLSVSASSAQALDSATRGNDIALSWQGGGACEATIEFSARQGDTATTYDTVCSFPSNDGSGTIPAVALEPFPAGLGPAMSYTFTCTVTTDVVVGDWAIDIRALADARRPEGTSAAGAISTW